MRRAALLALLALPAVATAQESYNYLPFKMMNTAANPFPWYLDARSPNPEGLALADVQAATTAAWQTWDDVACASTAFSFQGPTTSAIPDPRDAYDVFNVSTIWITAYADPYYQSAIGGSDVTAMTLPLSYGGVLQQCDIYLNGVDRTWSTLSTTPTGVVDVQTIVLHEVGHCQGLDHSFVAEQDVMNAATPIGASKRVLSARDTQTLCQRYPTTSTVGSPCFADGGCGSNPALKCVTPDGTDAGPTPPMCTVGCPTGQNFQCDLPYVCKTSTAFSPSFNGACLPPGQFVTQVGHPCTQNQDCGSTNGQCFVAGSLPSGFPWWQAGYCTQDCNPGQPACPNGSTCIDFGGSDGRWCLQTCRIGTADCRPGYTCIQTPDGSKGICVSSCHGDQDCNPPGVSNDVCRNCDGTCLAKQNPSGQIGDPCSSADSCGAGQVCALLGKSSQGICTQSCARACMACPVGTSCHPVGSRGDLYCLRDCTPGTCPAGLQCGQLDTGRGCMPPCQTDVDCPVGNQCILGECTNPYANPDSGCTLCQPPQDGGDRPNNGIPDAGRLPGPGSGGCGCGQTGEAAGLSAALAMLLAFAGRRSRPPARSGRRR